MFTKTIWNKVYNLSIQLDNFSSDPLGDAWINIVFNWCGGSFNNIYDMWRWRDTNYYHYFKSTYHILESLSDYCFEDSEIEIIDKYISDNFYLLPVHIYEHSWISLTAWKWWKVYPSDNCFIYIKKNEFDTEEQWMDFLEENLWMYNKYINWEVYEYYIEQYDTIEKDWKKYCTSPEYYDSWSWFYSLDDIITYLTWDIFLYKELYDYTESLNIY